MNVQNVMPKLDFSYIARPTRLQVFERLFPKTFVIEVMFPEMNLVLNQLITWGEFLVFLGIWLLMSTVKGPQQRDYWSSKVPSPLQGAPWRVNHFMTQNRFEAILSSLVYTNIPSPSYHDPFHPI